MLPFALKTWITLWVAALVLSAPAPIASRAPSAAAPPAAPAAPTETPRPAATRAWPELPPTPARLRVRRGWASLITGGEPERVGVHSRAHSLDGASFLSLASDSVVELRWAGRGSLRITGPAELEWDPPRRARDPLRVRFLSWRAIDAESRRGAGIETLLQSEAWCIAGSAGAWQLSRGLGGTSNLRHHGGLPLRVEALAPGEQVKSVRELRSGERLLLPAPEPVAKAPTRKAGRAAAEERQAARSAAPRRRRLVGADD